MYSQLTAFVMAAFWLTFLPVLKNLQCRDGSWVSEARPAGSSLENLSNDGQESRPKGSQDRFLGPLLQFLLLVLSFQKIFRRSFENNFF